MNKFLTFTKGERVAVIVLAAVIFFIIAANFFVANRPSNVNLSLHNLDSIVAIHEAAVEEQSRIDAETQSRKVTKSTFKVVKSTSQRDLESQKTRISKNQNNPELKVQQPKSKNQLLIVNLNSADTTELLSLPNIGPFFARNIVSYREKLGGFIDKNQLLEVYAFDTVRLAAIENHIVIDSVVTRKVKINSDDFKTILRHPYIEYEDVKKIINYRESKGLIKDWKTYLKVVERDSIDERLELYLEFDN